MHLANKMCGFGDSFFIYFALEWKGGTLTDSVLESSGVDLDFAELAIILSQRYSR